MKEVVITSSVLIGVILLTRRLFRGKVSQKLIYATWLLVALRLLIPIQFGHSQYSVTTLTEKIEDQSKPIQQVQEALQEPIVGPSRTELYAQLLNEYIQQNSDHSQPETPEQITPEIQQQIQEEVDTHYTAPTLSEILTILWLIGSCAMTVWFLTANLIYLHRARKDATPYVDRETPIPVRVSPHVSTPCLVGFFRPTIYLTPGCTQNVQTIEHVLTHELTHLSHGDHIWSLVRCVCLCLHWFNPLVWIAAIMSRRDCELACDESALKKLGDDQRIAYGQTLLATVTKSTFPTHLIETATAMNETKKQLKERVSFIVKRPDNILIVAVCMILVAALAVGCTFTGSQITAPGNNTPTATGPNLSNGVTSPTFSPHDDKNSFYPDTNGTSVQMLSAEQVTALRSAEALINDYMWYKFVGVCCDFELDTRDMSNFLTEKQKSSYNGQQYLLKCCHSVTEVKAHIDNRLDHAVQFRGYPDDALFTDNQGNLYLIITPTGYDGYRHIKLNECGADRIIVSACIYDEDECRCYDTFTMERTGNDVMIVQIETINIPPVTPSTAPPMSSADYRASTFELAQKQFGLSYVEFLYAGNAIVHSVITECDPQNVQAFDLSLRDAGAIYHRILFVDHDNTVMMHFPIFSSQDGPDTLGGYYVREFTVPNEEYFQCNAYRWFFGELGKTTDRTYALMLLDAAFQSPDLFLEYISERDDTTISTCSNLMHSVIASQEEYELYVRLLIAMSSRTNLTDREKHALTMLSAKPDGFRYHGSPASPPDTHGNSVEAVSGQDPQLPNGLILTPPSNTLSHTHVYETTTVKPTCTVKGYDYHLCHCGMYFCDTFISAAGHHYQFNGVAAAKTPSYDTPGFITMECWACGDRYRSPLTAGKDVDFDAITKGAGNYARTLGFTVIQPEDWNHVELEDHTSRIEAKPIYLSYTDLHVTLTEHLKRDVDRIYQQFNSSGTSTTGYVIYMDIQFTLDVMMQDVFILHVRVGYPPTQSAD